MNLLSMLEISDATLQSFVEYISYYNCINKKLMI